MKKNKWDQLRKVDLREEHKVRLRRQKIKYYLSRKLNWLLISIIGILLTILWG